MKKAWGFSLFDFLNVVIKNHRLLIKPVKLSDGLKQAYWHTSNSWQALISLLCRNLSIHRFGSRPCCRCLRSLMSSCKQSRVDFPAFSPLPIMDFKVVEFHYPNMPCLYSGPSK